MTSRERVMKALNHEEPDRVPIDLGGNQTGIHKFAHKALIEHLGIRDELVIMDAVQQLYMDISHHPLADATIDDSKEYPFPKGHDMGRFDGMRARALMLKNETPYAVVAMFSVAFTTSRPVSRRRTSSRCMIRCMSLEDMSELGGRRVG